MAELSRFIKAQDNDYERALSEIKSGKKRTHWMWYVFPQIKGLGFSETAKYYSIENIKEAEAFLAHPLLGARLIEISNALLELPSDDAYAILGSPDDAKLKSSMTLFSSLHNTNHVFEAVLNKFFNGMKDEKTLAIISS